MRSMIQAVWENLITESPLSTLWLTELNFYSVTWQKNHVGWG